MKRTKIGYSLAVACALAGGVLSSFGYAVAEDFFSPSYSLPLGGHSPGTVGAWTYSSTYTAVLDPGLAPSLVGTGPYSFVAASGYTSVGLQTLNLTSPLASAKNVFFNYHYVGSTQNDYLHFLVDGSVASVLKTGTANFFNSFSYNVPAGKTFGWALYHNDIGSDGSATISSFGVTPAAVPEISTIAMNGVACAGVGGIGMVMYRRRKVAATV